MDSLRPTLLLFHGRCFQERAGISLEVLRGGTCLSGSLQTRCRQRPQCPWLRRLFRFFRLDERSELEVGELFDRMNLSWSFSGMYFAVRSPLLGSPRVAQGCVRRWRHSWEGMLWLVAWMSVPRIVRRDADPEASERDSEGNRLRVWVGVSGVCECCVCVCVLVRVLDALLVQAFHQRGVCTPLRPSRHFSKTRCYAERV